jgi:hypothetical protein
LCKTGERGQAGEEIKKVEDGKGMVHSGEKDDEKGSEMVRS